MIFSCIFLCISVYFCIFLYISVCILLVPTNPLWDVVVVVVRVQYNTVQWQIMTDYGRFLQLLTGYTVDDNDRKQQGAPPARPSGALRAPEIVVFSHFDAPEPTYKWL